MSKIQKQSSARQSRALDKMSATESWTLHDRPGFLIRRLHQIHVALFAKHCEPFGVTPVQFSLLTALAARGVADQTLLAADVALDRTTATGAIKRLQDRGLAQRVASAGDRRARLWSMTTKGGDLLEKMQASVREAHDATIAALAPAERSLLVALLRRLVAAHEAAARANAPDLTHAATFQLRASASSSRVKAASSDGRPKRSQSGRAGKRRTSTP
jgi:MarR family transcriptional regulator, lower aerobic nicotinate degradation pathway regulator